MSDELSIRDLRMLARRQPDLITLDLLLISTFEDRYAKFVDLVEQAMDWISQELARNPQHRQGFTEDELTECIITPLRAMGFDAWHDAAVGGHCDITIEGRDEFLWLGEAKIDRKDNSWLFKGFQQLTTRYSTGSKNQNVGGLVIYCFNQRIDITMTGWKDYLQSKVREIVTEDCTRNPPTFSSIHQHDRTGQSFRVRHLPVSLYFQPRDQRAKKPKRKKDTDEV